MDIITTDSLIDGGRTAKKALRPWISQLICRTEGLLDPTEKIKSFPEELSSIQNNFALITLFMLGVAAAREECLAQITWAQSFTGDGEVLQPYINLARLDRISGDLRGSKNKLQKLLEISECGHGHIENNPFIASEKQRHFLMNACRAELFLSMIKNHSALLTFLSESTKSEDIDATEAERLVIGGNLIKSPTHVWQGLKSKSWFKTSHVRYCGMFYRASVSISDDKNNVVKRFLQEVSSYLENPHQSIIDHCSLRFIHRSALLAERTNNYEYAITLLDRTISLATTLKDVEYLIRAKYTLAKLTGAKSDWGDIAAVSGFRRLKGIPEFTCSQVEQKIILALYEDLKNTINRARSYNYNR